MATRGDDGSRSLASLVPCESGRERRRRRSLRRRHPEGDGRLGPRPGDGGGRRSLVADRRRPPRGPARRARAPAAARSSSATHTTVPAPRLAAPVADGSTPTCSPRTRICSPCSSAEAPRRRGAGRAAQACRLPVTPYRTAVAPWTPVRLTTTPAAAAGSIRPADVAVLDLTAMWAGPLAHDAARRLGRPRRDRRADRPPRRAARLARPSSPRPRSGKRRRPWDLRERDDRAAFEEAVRRADVLVESFSASRARPTSATTDRRAPAPQPRPRRDLVRAFPSTVPTPWVAYGRGVHAASGLGMVAGEPTPALLAYPDPLAGLAAVRRRAATPCRRRRRATSRSAWPARSRRCCRAPVQPLGELDRRCDCRAGGAATGGRPGRWSSWRRQPEASATRSIGWRTVMPAASRCIAQPGLALATTVAPERARGPLDRPPPCASRTSPASAGCSAE